jgi:hypothetical protein
MRLGLWRTAYGEPDATAFRRLPLEAEAVKAARHARGAAHADIASTQRVNSGMGSFCSEALAHFGQLDVVSPVGRFI